MDVKALEKVLGTGLLQDGQFGEIIRKHFPDASEVDLYGAGVTFDGNGQVIAISCKGRTVQFDGDNSER